jgi:hypothetical protein
LVQAARTGVTEPVLSLLPHEAREWKKIRQWAEKNCEKDGSITEHQFAWSVPVRSITCGSEEALSVMEMRPDFGPGESGEKVTLMPRCWGRSHVFEAERGDERKRRGITDERTLPKERPLSVDPTL